MPHFFLLPLSYPFRKFKSIKTHNICDSLMKRNPFQNIDSKFKLSATVNLGKFEESSEKRSISTHTFSIITISFFTC